MNKKDAKIVKKTIQDKQTSKKIKDTKNQNFEKKIKPQLSLFGKAN